MDDERPTAIQGLPYLLRSVADRNDVDSLNKELLRRSAEKIDQLEWVADIAMKIVDGTPRDGEGASKTMVARHLVIDLMIALRGAGKRVKDLRV